MQPRHVDNTPEGHDHRARGRPAPTCRARRSRSPPTPGRRTGVDLGAVPVRRRPGPTSTGRTICTDNRGAVLLHLEHRRASPAGTTSVRAVMTRPPERRVTSSSGRVTLEQLRGASVDATNVGNPGQPAAGDTDHLTYSTTVNLNTVRPASWNGSSTTAVGHHRRRRRRPATDYLTVPGTNLGSVTFDQDYVDDGRQAARSTVDDGRDHGRDRWPPRSRRSRSRSARSPSARRT